MGYIILVILLALALVLFNKLISHINILTLTYYLVKKYDDTPTDAELRDCREYVIQKLIKGGQ